MTEPRICAYPPCPVGFTSSHPKARYHDPKCKAADWKRRHGYGRQRTVRTDAGRPGGEQLARGRAVAMLVRLGHPPEKAERIVRAHLPARQRARLLERGS